MDSNTKQTRAYECVLPSSSGVRIEANKSDNETVYWGIVPPRRSARSSAAAVRGPLPPRAREPAQGRSIRQATVLSRPRSTPRHRAPPPSGSRAEHPAPPSMERCRRSLPSPSAERADSLSMRPAYAPPRRRSPAAGRRAASASPPPPSSAADGRSLPHRSCSSTTGNRRRPAAPEAAATADGPFERRLHTPAEPAPAEDAELSPAPTAASYR